MKWIVFCLLLTLLRQGFGGQVLLASQKQIIQEDNFKSWFYSRHYYKYPLRSDYLESLRKMKTKRMKRTFKREKGTIEYYKEKQ